MKKPPRPKSKPQTKRERDQMIFNTRMAQKKAAAEKANKGPVKRKVPKGRPGSTLSAVQYAAANRKRKKPGKPTKATGDYNFAAGGNKPPAKKKKPSALKRLVKFAKGDYTK